MNISHGCVVTIRYTLTKDGGDILDSSDDTEPLTYLHGFDGMIPRLEYALEGKSEGESLKVDLSPEEGYGPVNPDLIHDVPLGALAQFEDLAVGMQLRSTDEQGRDITLVVDTISESHVTLNANHPMAGESLHFDILVEGVRAATDDEIAIAHAKMSQDAN